MEQEITQFINSDSGFITALILVVLGVSDLASGYYLARYRPEMIPLPPHLLNRFMTAIYFVSSFLVLVGIYMLYIRA